MSSPKDNPRLQFSWRDFIYGRAGKCFPACIVMCCRYWVHFDPSLDLPMSLEELADRTGATFISKSGLQTERLNNILQKESEEIEGELSKFGLDIEPKTPKNIEGLGLFLQLYPPVPIILSFDIGYTEKRVSSDPHAVILYSIDYERRIISVIDPQKRHLGGPYDYPFEQFIPGWEQCNNLMYVVAPVQKLKLISGDTLKVVKQVSLERFE